MSWHYRPEQLRQAIGAWIPTLYPGSLLGLQNTPDLIGAVDGTNNGGVTFIDEGITNAQEFNGTDAYVDFGAAGQNLFDIVSNDRIFTLSFWFRLRDHTADAVQVFVSSAVSSSQIGFYCSYDNRTSINSRAIVFSIYTGGGSGTFIAVTATDAVSDNGWHHFAALAGGEVTTTLITYLDSVELSRTSSDQAKVSPSTFTPALGRGQHTAPFGYFDGWLDDVRLFERNDGALIPQLYNSGRGHYFDWTKLGGEVGAWIPTISGDNDAGDLV